MNKKTTWGNDHINDFANDSGAEKKNELDGEMNEEFRKVIKDFMCT